MKKRLFASLLCLALCLSLLPITALADGDGGVEYIERGWDGSAVTEQVKTIDTYTTITSDTIPWNDGWYVAQGEVTIGTDDDPQRVTVTGDVHLILTDGCTLTVNGGIQLEAGDSLTIYGQSEQAGTMGRLIASITEEDASIYDAVIGGNGSDTGGNDGGAVTIHGGFISATATIFNHNANAGTGNTDGTGDTDGTDGTGGNDDASIGSAYGAAIGGGGTKTGNGGNGGTATVYGGAVEATVTVIDVSQSDPDTSQGNNNGSFAGDSYGAAIGGGGSETGNGGDGGTITIFGGTVRAESSCGAGIGGGSGGSGGGEGGNITISGGEGGNITISGGTVRAESFLGAGIGGGSGGGGGGDGGTITISGGAVRAESYYGGGIGGGGDLSGGDTGGDGSTITISGGTVEVQSVSGAGIGGGNSGFGPSNWKPKKGTGGSGGTITISGGSVTATTMTGRTIGLLSDMKAGRWAGAAIGGSFGGSSGNITISGGTVTAIVSSQTAPHADSDADPIYSAGIGSSSSSSSSGGGTITISGGTVFAQSPDGAGIGCGENSDGSDIVIAISGGTVEAVSTNGAGIGGGMIESLSAMVNFETIYSGGEITISGGSVSAQSTNGAGIGSGAVIYDVEEVSERNTPEVNGGEITVSGGTVSAQSVRGAGIGGGSGQVTVGSTVTVDSEQTTPSLTPYSSDGGTVTISGGTVEAVSTEGVGIGSGGMPFYQSESPAVDQYIHCVSGEAGTFATGTDGNAMLFATGRIAHIEDDDDTSAWQGVIFLGSEGQLYGTSVTLSEDVTIPSGNTLEIGQGQTLSVGRGVTMTIDNENCLTGGGTLGAGGSYEILNPLPVFTPTTLFYTGSDLSGRLSLTAPAGSVSIMGQIFTVSGTPTYRDWVITLPAGGILQVGTYTVTAYSPSQGRTVSGQITVIGDSSSTPTYSVILPGRVEGGTVTAKKSYAEEGETFRFTVTPDEGWELDTLSVTDNRGTELDVKYEGDSVYSFKMPARRVEIQVSFREIPPESLPFTDIADNAWYADAVRYVYKHGLMAGTSATTFAPDVTTSRSMIATILWRMAGSPVVNYAMDYTDVAQGQWYSEAIRWAASEGIVGGYGNGLFGTNDPITREQLATMLWRYAQSEGYDVSVGESTNILSYTDVANLADYAIAAMQWAVGAGIINGTGDGSALTPQGQATRAQAAVMLMRFCEEYVTW